MLETLKPFGVGAILAVVGGWVGLFSNLFLVTFHRAGIGPALGYAFVVSFLPPALFVATYLALCGTLLLPIAYYLSRGRWPVTPARYAVVGTVLAVAVLVCFLLWQGRTLDFTLAGWAHPGQMSIAFGTVLAGAICGSLFGWLMRSHYERYRLARTGST